ncbi:alpha/beta fold hydrolase, partial [Nocardia brasiliensis]|uniref:alpha/beta fold hydrolase n=1 Tax=Nocardia brasiliensis TaxID=37326 RepID=UPI0024559CF6
MPFARAIDADIHYEDSGGSGPVVLLAHEFFMDRTMFAAQMAALAPEFRIVSWDARGHGRTRDEGLPFTYWTAARDALTVLDHVGAERAVVGGTAAGGVTRPGAPGHAGGPGEGRVFFIHAAERPTPPPSG